MIGSIKRRGEEIEPDAMQGDTKLPSKKRQKGGLKTEGKEASEGLEAPSAVQLLHKGSSSPSGSEKTQPKKVPPIPSFIEDEGVTFPEKLMELLMEETDKEALWWLPDGEAFAINSKRFTKAILAKKFQGSKFESFTRKLARW